MKDLLLPMMFDNGQSIRDGYEIGRLSKQAANLSRQLASQQAGADSLRTALTYSQQAAAAYAEVADIAERQRARLQDMHHQMVEDPTGLQTWVQVNLNEMRSRLVRAMISNDRLLTQSEDDITAAERRRLNEHLVAFAFVMWKGTTRFMRHYDEAQAMLEELNERVQRDEAAPTWLELARILSAATSKMGVAQEQRLPSWPGINWITGTAKTTLRERTELAQQELQRDMQDGEVVFEDDGNRLVAAPGFKLRGINQMLHENWSWIMDKQFA